MTRIQKTIIVLCFIAAAWVFLFPSSQPASSSYLYGFTVTVVTRTSTPTDTATPTREIPGISPTPTNTPQIPTLPPPTTRTGVLIPVTGADHSAPSGLLITSGLVVLALGMVLLGLSMRQKQ